MNTITDKKLDQLLSTDDAQPIAREHREWMNRRIRQTLEKKAKGELSYKSLDQVRRELGLDAS